MNRPDRLDLKSSVVMPCIQVPSFRLEVALQGGLLNNILILNGGGIGDILCTEPTIRFCAKTNPNVEFSLATFHPELFSHLNLKKVYDLEKELPELENYYVLRTLHNSSDLIWEFIGHMVINCIDYPSLSAFRCQLPVLDREIFLAPALPAIVVQDFLKVENGVFLHPGKHWPSKTFPKGWWDKVIEELLADGMVPILIGANTDDNRGTVDVEAKACIDLRNKLSLGESIWLLQRSKVLITNDSSPLHMAASRDPNDEATGKNWIGFIATCKHPDFISHWRSGQWNHREENLGLGGIWEYQSNLPNTKENVSVEFVDEAVLKTWLPEPLSVARWAKGKM